MGNDKEPLMMAAEKWLRKHLNLAMTLGMMSIFTAAVTLGADCRVKAHNTSIERAKADVADICKAHNCTQDEFASYTERAIEMLEHPKTEDEKNLPENIRLKTIKESNEKSLSNAHLGK